MTKTTSKNTGIMAASDTTFDEVWKRFKKRYPTDQSCLAEIVKRILDRGLPLCKKCRENNWKVGKKRLMRCRKCRSRVSITAGTFFEHMRSHKAWMAAIFFAENGVLINSVAFHKLLGIAQSSAQAILRKVMAVLQSHMNFSVANASSSSFLELFCKRSCETPVREHPRAEEEAAAAMKENAPSDSPRPEQSAEINAASNEETDEAEEASEIESLSDEEKSVLAHLNTAPRHQNFLSQQSGLPPLQTLQALTMLEIGGFCIRVPGNHYVLARHKLPASRRSTTAETPAAAGTNSTRAASDAIWQVFHGISRKYLQGYLALHWCFLSRSHWSHNSLLEACISFGKLTVKQTRELVTPLSVKVANLKVKLIPVFT